MTMSVNFYTVSHVMIIFSITIFTIKRNKRSGTTSYLSRGGILGITWFSRGSTVANRVWKGEYRKLTEKNLKKHYSRPPFTPRGEKNDRSLLIKLSNSITSGLSIQAPGKHPKNSTSRFWEVFYVRSLNSAKLRNHLRIADGKFLTVNLLRTRMLPTSILEWEGERSGYHSSSTFPLGKRLSGTIALPVDDTRTQPIKNYQN